MKKVRTRFAPSPTGYMHIGNLRTALYAYLIARKNGGDFLLRIEDTDQEREIEGAVEVIYKTMAETGLHYDEGPDKGGDFGPYIQSERRDLYKKYAHELVELGGAYYCFCTKERLDEMKDVQEASKMPQKYDGKCSRLSSEEIKANLDSGIPYVVRQKIPREGNTDFDDMIFGTISTPNESLDDNVLLKTDGLPTYNFANVIDDYLMEISHVVRGTEYLSSSPKYNLIYNAFGWDVPKYVHCPPVMKDESNKLSKRNGDASYEDLLSKGYLKDAVLNYIALLGWSPKGEQEKFTLKELEEIFEIDGISKSPSIFDPKKLDWLNGEYIRALSEDEFYSHAEPYLENVTKVDKKEVAKLLQKRCDKFSDITEQVDFFDELPSYDTELFVHKKMKTDRENSLEALGEILPVIKAIENFSFDNLHDELIALATKLELKNGRILWPLRVAVSGKAFTPGGGVELAFILGKDETIKRIETAISLLS